MVEALRRLRQENAEIAQVLGVLEAQIVASERGETPNCEQISRALDYCLSYPAICHHPKEDLILRRLHSRDPAAAKEFAGLFAEHELLEDKTCKFSLAMRSALEGGQPSVAEIARLGRDFLEFYCDHMQSEEAYFFPLALSTLSDEDWAEVDAQVSDPESPLFGAQIEKEYAALREEVLGR